MSQAVDVQPVGLPSQVKVQIRSDLLLFNEQTQGYCDGNYTVLGDEVVLGHL